MHNAADISYGISSADKAIAAESRTAPAEVTHEFTARGERKKTIAGKVV